MFGLGLVLGLDLGVWIRVSVRVISWCYGYGYAIDPHRIFIKPRTILLISYKSCQCRNND